MRRLLLRLCAAATVLGGLAWMALHLGSDLSPATLSRLRPGWLLAAAALWSSGFAFHGLRWRALVPLRRRPPAGRMGLLLWGATSLNLALPGPAGDLAAAWLASRRLGLPLAAGLPSLVLGRLVGLACSGAATIALWGLLAGELRGAWTAALAVALAVAALLPLWACRDPELVSRAGALLHRVLPSDRLLDRSRFWGRCLGRLGRLGPRRWAAAAGWSLANTVVQSAALQLAAGAAAARISYPVAVFTFSSQAVATAAAVVSPGGLGPVDAFLYGLLAQATGLPPARVLLCAIAWRWSLLLGLLAAAPVAIALLAALPRGWREEREAVAAAVRAELEGT